MKTKRGSLIVIEGLDGVGKTTCASKVAEIIGGIYYKTPPKGMGNVQNKLEIEKNYKLRFLYYMYGNVYASNEIERLLENGNDIVCDRYIYSTMAYHLAIGVEIPENIQNLVISPDFSFLLFTEEEERKKRMNTRKERGQLGWADFSSRFQAKVWEEFKKMGLTLIDNTHLSPDETSKKIAEIILYKKR